MQQNDSPVSRRIRGWILDVYPSAFGEIAVWIIGENGERIRLADTYQPKVYISGKAEDIESLASGFYANKNISSWTFAYKYAQLTDAEKSKVLEVALKDSRRISAFTREILKLGDYLTYEVHNCDLHGDRAYFFDHDLFPFAFVEVENRESGLKYTLLDSVQSIDYTLPPLRTIKLQVEIAKTGKIPTPEDPISHILLTQGETQTLIDRGEETDKLLKLVETIESIDPDIILTSGGDSFLLPYLIQRANINGLLNKLILSRDPVPFATKSSQGRTFFSYGRTFYKAPTTRLFGRIHIDERNTFIMSESGFDGLFEIARTCRVPLHTSARFSIGASMLSLQLYQAVKDDVLIPRNKSMPEAFKTAYELLVADRGGFVYEPEVGIHDNIFEVDFSSMYPSLMINNNISAETVLCKCCPNSRLRIPELNYHICEKRIGIVPKALKLFAAKRLQYKRLKEEAQDPKLKQMYDSRQTALKWILVTCFGYLGYKNSKFGTVDGHIGVCAFGRDAFLRAARKAENKGFTVIHGIVDSLWLKEEGASIEECRSLCHEVTAEIGIPLNFEGRYKWIMFLPSKVNPNISVLNRYYGVMETGKVKLRGIEIRRHDTPSFIYNAQMEMINVLATANNKKEFLAKIPEALNIIKQYREKLLGGEVPVWDLIITKYLSKQPGKYKQQVSQVIAAKQLIKEGREIHAGNSVSFLFTDAENKRHDRRVKAEPLIDMGVRADIKKYLLLLYGSAVSLLGSCGFTEKTVYDAIRGYDYKTLDRFATYKANK
jgi:DNA polymerase, archaea type